MNPVPLLVFSRVLTEDSLVTDGNVQGTGFREPQLTPSFTYLVYTHLERNDTIIPGIADSLEKFPCRLIDFPQCFVGGTVV